MASDIDKYFAGFTNLPDPSLLREGLRASIPFLADSPAFKDHRYPLQTNAPEYAYIGKIAAEWANLETRIDELIWEFCLPAPANLAACLTSQLIGPRARLHALSAICGELGTSSEAIERLAVFTKHACGVAEQRNRFVHDSWFVSARSTGERVVKSSVTAKASFKRETKEVTIKDFDRLIYKIQKLNDVFWIHVRQDLVNHTFFKNVFDKKP